MKGKLIFRRPAPRVQVAIDATIASSGSGVWRLVWYAEALRPPNLARIIHKLGKIHFFLPAEGALAANRVSDFFF